MHDDDTARVPLWRGPQIVGYALVDSADLPLVADDRWRVIAVHMPFAVEAIIID